MIRRIFKQEHPNPAIADFLTGFLLNRAVEFDAGNPVELNGRIMEDDDEVEFHHHYTICWKGQTGWAITQGGRMCLSKSQKEFIYEPLPSNRDSFIEDTRFPSVEEALLFLDNWKKDRVLQLKAKGWLTFKEWCKHVAKALQCLWPEGFVPRDVV